MPIGNDPAARPAGLEILSGPGVHSGMQCRLELRLRESPPGFRAVQPGFQAASLGPTFIFPGFPDPLGIEQVGRLPVSARRATVLGHAGARISTPEHLLHLSSETIRTFSRQKERAEKKKKKGICPG